LFEEMLMDEEGLEKTDNSLIYIGQPLVFDGEAFLQKLDQLYDEVYSETVDVKAFVSELVPTYKIKEADKVRDRKKIDEKYHQIAKEKREGFGGK